MWRCQLQKKVGIGFCKKKHGGRLEQIDVLGRYEKNENPKFPMNPDTLTSTHDKCHHLYGHRWTDLLRLNRTSPNIFAWYGALVRLDRLTGSRSTRTVSLKLALQTFFGKNQSTCHVGGNSRVLCGDSFHGFFYNGLPTSLSAPCRTLGDNGHTGSVTFQNGFNLQSILHHKRYPIRHHVTDQNERCWI